MAATTTAMAGREDGSPRSEAERMRAVLQERYGEAEVLRVGEMERPRPGPGEVLIQVKAAGLDRGTWHLMAGKPYLVRLGIGLRTPRTPIPGRELAGVVMSVGEGVTRLRPGDEVFGTTWRGAFAELTVAPETLLARKPSRLTFVQAAATPVSALTAVQGLCDVGAVKAGQKVLVIGASGGVGTFAVQLARSLGAEVTGVCSAGKREFVASLGAARVLDYTRDDFADGSARYDLILDTGGNTPLRRLRRALTARGTLVIVGGEGAGDWFGMGRQLRAVAWNPFVSQNLKMLIIREHHTELERLRTFIDEGKLLPVVERTYALEEAAEAMRHLVSGRARGKLVVTP